jgi:MCP family monocarboxylic acid transporter-like MFS transporter 10
MKCSSQMMLSLCSSYYQIILAQGVGVGLSMGLMFNLAVGIPTHWFQRRRAFALGVQSTGSSLGGVIFPIMIRKLFTEIGYPWTMRLIGFGALILLGASWFLMRTRLPPIANVKNGGWKKVKWFDPTAFKQWSYTLFVIGCTLILFGLYTPFVYISEFTATYNIPASNYWLSVMNAASIFGRVIPGLMADRFGRMNVLWPHTALAAIVLFMFPLFTNVSATQKRAQLESNTYADYSSTVINHLFCYYIRILLWLFR